MTQPDKLFYPGEEVVAVNKAIKGIDDNADRASNLVFNKTYTIEMYWRFYSGHWWISVVEINDAVYTEDEFASLISLEDKLYDSGRILLCEEVDAEAERM